MTKYHGRCASPCLSAAKRTGNCFLSSSHCHTSAACKMCENKLYLNILYLDISSFPVISDQSLLSNTHTPCTLWESSKYLSMMKIITKNRFPSLGYISCHSTVLNPWELPQRRVPFGWKKMKEETPPQLSTPSPPNSGKIHFEIGCTHPSTMLLDPGREAVFEVLGSKPQHPVHGVIVDGSELANDVYCKGSLKALSSDLWFSPGIHTP